MIASGLAPGTTLAGFRIERTIGSGGMGIVYQATQLSLGRQVALKVLAPFVTNDPEFRERFRREGVLQAAVENPHVVTVYEAGESPEGLYIAMRLIRGENLKQRLLGGGLDPAAALEIAAQIGSALDTAHDAGIIHRDVKPQNILLEESTDKAYLADFGLTKASGQSSLTRTHGYLGSLDYVAPEQLRSEPLTASSDIYALGAVLFEALSGQVPFPRDTEAAIMYAHVWDPPPPLSSFRPELAELDDVLLRSLSKEPGERPSSASAMVEEARSAYARIAPARPSGPKPLAAGIPDAPPRESGATVIGRIPALEQAPVPAQPTRGRPFPIVPLAIASAVVLIVGVVAFLAGHSRTGKAVSSVRPVGKGSLVVQAPRSWERIQPPSSVTRALGLRSAYAVSDPGGPLLVAGLASGAPGSPLWAATHQPRARRATVRLQRMQASRYSGIRLTAGRKATLFVVPTTGPSVAVACLDSGKDTDEASCQAVAATLTTGRLVALAPSPSATVARSVNRLVRSLQAQAAGATARLRKATTAASQSIAARRLSTLYATSSRRLATTKAAPEDGRLIHGLAASLIAASSAYGRLARAAQASDGSAYQTAAASVSRAVAGVREAIQAFKGDGYTIGA